MGAWRTRRESPPTWLYLTVGVFVVFGFAFATFQVWSNDLALRDRGQEAAAQVVAVSDKGRRITVRFTTSAGREVQARVGQGDEAPGPRAQVGDEIPVVYDPEHPTADVRDSRAPENHSTAYLLLGATLFGAVAFLWSAWQAVGDRRRRRAASP